MKSPLATALAFDIETIPDADLLRRHHNLSDASDEEIIEIGRQSALERSDGSSDFLPLVFHKVLVISVLMRGADNLHINSKAYPRDNEKTTVSGFFGLIDKLNPVLVSWNGNGFDLPVLHLRAMRHGLTAHGYWNGPGDKWDQYSSRYHNAHQDVMDILAQRNPRANTSLELAALNCDLPGKLGYDGKQVHGMHLAGKHAEISNYCELDVLNTYLLWVRLQQLTGKISPEQHDEECALIESVLSSSPEKHHTEFLSAWLALRC